MKKWVEVFRNKSAARRIRSDIIKEISWQEVKNQDDGTRWMLNISWDRGASHGTGMVKEGDSLFFDSKDEMMNFIADHWG